MIYADRNLAQKLERTEASANRAFVEARAALEPESGATWTEVAGAYAMFDGSAESPLTQTFGLGVFEDATHDDLEKLEAFFRERNAPVSHEISPMADASLLNLLGERGYQPIELTSVLYRALETESEFDLRLNPNIKTRIIEPGEEKLWAQTSASGWSTEAPGLKDFMLGFGQISAAAFLSFLAELDGAPVAAGALVVRDDCALLAGASTVPAGRRQGAQTALLDARLKYARAQGCRIAMMGASPGSQSQRNAEKHGFRIAYTRIKWHLKN
jgi:GNAT superfamily N-acetyltransferase